MNGNSTPQLNECDAQVIVQDLLARLPGYVPGWQPVEGGPSWALIQIFARYLQAVYDRLNQAPDKNKLAFFDLLGINLLPAQAARAPVVFQPLLYVGDGRIPARTRLGAQVPGQSEPLMFETEQAIALTAAQLAQVVTLFPGSDQYADHTEAAIAHQPFTLFSPLKPVPHEVYLAHETYFALAGQSIVEVQFELNQPAQEPLLIIWEYWDGKVWRAFKSFEEPKEATQLNSLDGTQGLTRSGVIRLVAEYATSAKTKINGIESYWIRARLDPKQSLPATANFVLPLVTEVCVSTLIEKNISVIFLSESSQIEAPQTARIIRNVDIGVGTDLEKINLIEPSSLTDQIVQSSARASIVDVLRHASADIATNILKLFRYRFPFITFGSTQPESAFADSMKLDLTKSFYPFGQYPQPGNAFYLKSMEVFSKPGARVSFYCLSSLYSQSTTIVENSVDTNLVAEYWDGRSWRDLEVGSEDLKQFFTASIPFEIAIPPDQTITTINNEEGFWLRIRLVDQGFIWTHPINNQTGIEINEVVAPLVTAFRLGYTYQSPADNPQICLTYNDFQWQDHTQDAYWRGDSFEPFSIVADQTPTLYLGFDRPLPTDLISLYCDIEEKTERTQGPLLAWEYWDGTAWLPLSVRDETHNLVLPGMITAIWTGSKTPPPIMALYASGSQIQLLDPRQVEQFVPGDQLYVAKNGAGETITIASVANNTLTLEKPLSQIYMQPTLTQATLARFGKPYTWIRARFQDDGEPVPFQINGIYLNAVWAAQVQTIENEVLGSSNAQPNQVFFIRNTPVLAGEIVEVQELQGARAPIEYPLLREELKRQGFPETAIRTVNDPRTGKINQVWVQWQGCPHLLFSGATDRHYVVERSRGRLVFGDGQRGKIPPAGNDNIRMRQYRAGGGQVGNVPANTITQLLSGALVQKAFNPRAAEGGADTEPIAAVKTRAPRALRHRYQAITLEDYEALAREASPAVAVARALPTTHPTGRSSPGWVKLLIMPHSQDAQPQPSFELRQQVQRFLAARVPATVADRITVVGPQYQPIGVRAVIVPVNSQDAGPVREQVYQALIHFLNPLTGGPEGEGWQFGRAIYLSDVAAMLERVTGVDYISELNLLLDGTPSPYGEWIPVVPERIVVAGPLQIFVKGNER